MTEKQFLLQNGKHMVFEYEFYKGKNRLSPLQVVDLLNKQYEEIQALKQEYNDAKSDVKRYEQILKDIMNDNLLIQDAKKELKC